MVEQQIQRLEQEIEAMKLGFEAAVRKAVITELGRNAKLNEMLTYGGAIDEIRTQIRAIQCKMETGHGGTGINNSEM